MVSAGWVQDLRARFTTLPMMSPGLMLATVESQQSQQVAVREMEVLLCTYPTWFAAGDFEGEGVPAIGEADASDSYVPFVGASEGDRVGHDGVRIGQRDDALPAGRRCGGDL